MNIDLNRGMPQIPPHAPYLLIVPGVALAALGLIVIVNPVLVAYMFGGCMLALGLVIAFAGWRLMRRMR
jgi:hypothetical protein